MELFFNKLGSLKEVKSGFGSGGGRETRKLLFSLRSDFLRGKKKVLSLCLRLLNKKKQSENNDEAVNLCVPCIVRCFVRTHVVCLIGFSSCLFLNWFIDSGKRVNKRVLVSDVAKMVNYGSVSVYFWV